MKNYWTLFAGVGAVCLLTAGTPICTDCVVLDCEISETGIVMEGPLEASWLIPSRLVLEAPDASCVVDVDPAAIAPLPEGRFALSTSLEGVCGEAKVVVLETLDESERFVGRGICGDPE